MNLKHRKPYLVNKKIELLLKVVGKNPSNVFIQRACSDLIKLLNSLTFPGQIVNLLAKVLCLLLNLCLAKVFMIVY